MTGSVPTILSMGLCLALAACGDEPSASAMEQAFRGVFVRMSPPQISVANLQLGGKAQGRVDDPTDIADFRKVGCVAGEPKGHVCEFTVTLNGIGRPVMKARFAHGPDGKLTMDD